MSHGQNEATAGQPTRYIKHIREKLRVYIYIAPLLSVYFFLLLLQKYSYLFNQIISTTISLL